MPFANRIRLSSWSLGKDFAISIVEKEHPYRIVTEIQLPAIDYENFITDMLADRQFLSDHGRRCKKGEVWDCLLVRRRGQPDGVLVMPKAECFVGWAAYYC